MSNQARVSSIDSLESFRGDLIQYIKKARIALEDMTSETRRTRDWLDTDRHNFWSREIKRRIKLLEQAEQELYSANLTSPLAANAIQKMAVMKAKRLLTEAEEKMRVITQWRKRFDNLSNPHLRQLDPLFALLTQTLPQGVHSLGETIKTLQSYAETSSPPPQSSTSNSHLGVNSKAILTSATRQLSERWSETRNSWRDQKADDYEKLYLAELFARVDSTVRVIEELEQLLNRVHADCD